LGRLGRSSRPLSGSADRGMAWVLAGALAYSAGALVYGLKRPNLVPGALGFHELWHLFVMAGSTCHFWAVLRYIAPLS
jgi:hemolysin III